MKHHLHVLIVNNSPMGTALCRALVRMGFAPQKVQDTTDAFALLNRQHFEMLFMDADLPRRESLNFLTRLQKEMWGVIPIVIARHMASHRAEKMIARGAYDVITMPISAAHLRIVILRALKRYESEGKAKEAVKKRVEQFSNFSRASDELFTEINSLKDQISILHAQVAKYRMQHSASPRT